MQRIPPGPAAHVAALAITILFIAWFAGGCERTKPVVVYVNSYHKGYPPSDDVMSGLFTVLDTTAYDVRVYFLDAKRSSPGDQERISREVASSLFADKPDILIASDDHAVAEIVVRHRDQIDFPVVFCGVNWSAAQYDLPPNTTGMVEVLPVMKCIGAVRSSGAPLKRITVLSEQSAAEEKNRRFIAGMLEQAGLEVEYIMVPDFAAWRENFIAAQQHSDAIFIPTNGAIRAWDHGEATAVVSRYAVKPVFTCDDFMVAYSAFGITKVAAEQGEWAGATAVKLLSGKRPAEIPVTSNQRTECWLNVDLYKKLNIRIPDLEGSCETFHDGRTLLQEKKQL